MSVSKENTPCKCTQISDESKKADICTMSKNEERVTQKIRLRIHEQIDLNTALLNEKLESLKSRVEQLESTTAHKEIATIFLRKASKLERCINSVIASQKGVFSKTAAPQSEVKERKLKGIHRKEENHNNSEDFQAISTSSSKDLHLAKDPCCPELAEELTNPPQNPKTKRGSHVKLRGDCTAMKPSRKGSNVC